MGDPVRTDELRTLFLFLADHDFAGYSPTYERIARHVAASPELLEFVDRAAAPNSRRGRVPVLFHAALHDLALTGTSTPLARLMAGDSSVDAAAAVDLAIAEHGADIVTTMRTRSVQTNEVGRSAAIAAGLATIDTGGRAIALIECGPSAGLNLFVDRWHVELVRDGTVIGTYGPSSSSVQLRCELRGPDAPPLGPLPSIGARTGVDPAPIDASDPVQSRWLRACLWPDLPERSARLEAALAVVALEPPSLVRGDAVTDLAPLVAAADPGLLPVVLSTWAMAYIPADGRASLVAALDAIGTRRDLAMLTLEEPRFTPGIDSVDRFTSAYDDEGDGTPTLLSLRRWREGSVMTTPLAMCHPHGRWMAWSDDGFDHGERDDG